VPEKTHSNEGGAYDDTGQRQQLGHRIERHASRDLNTMRHNQRGRG
jgi:hypothetical protein